MKTTDFIWANGDTCYLLNLIADGAKHDQNLDDLEKLLHSFEHLDSPR